MCDWVIEELQFIGKDECAQCLETYWREMDIGILATIIKYAQFPEQMAE